MSNFEDKLRGADAEDYPEKWKPEPGELVVGKYVHYNEIVSEFTGKPVGIMVIESLNSPKRLSVFMNTVLESQYLKWMPEVGDTVGIKRLPDRTNARGQPYKDYVLRIEGRDAPVPKTPHFLSRGHDKPDYSHLSADTHQDAPPQEASAPAQEEPDDDLPF